MDNRQISKLVDTLHSMFSAYPLFDISEGTNTVIVTTDTSYIVVSVLSSTVEVDSSSPYFTGKKTFYIKDYSRITTIIVPFVLQCIDGNKRI